MSTEAPPAPAPAAPTAAPTPTPAPAPALLGGIAATPAPVQTDPAPAATPAALPDDVPYIFKALNTNPDLKAYEKQLSAKFDKAQTPDELIAALGKSYAELEKFKGKPGADADEKAIAQWRKLNGVPETPQGYGLISNEKLKAMGVPENLAGEYEALFHGRNLSPEDAAAIIDGHAEIVSKLTEAQRTEQTNRFNQGVQELRAEHGKNFESVMRDAQTVHDLAMAGAGLKAEDVADLIDNPKYSKLLIALSKRLGQTPMIKGGMDSVIAGDNAKWKGMLSDPKSPLNDHTHPDHTRTIEEYARHKAAF